MPEAPEKPWYIIRRSDIHHRGIFARRDIPPDTPIIEYIGEHISKAESQRRAERLLAKSQKTGGAAVYIFELNKRTDIDGGMSWNPARLINHSCSPNCEAYIMRGRVWIHSLRNVAKGEELTYNYGFDLEHWTEHPCLCGSENCVGFIADKKHWPKLRRIIAGLKASRAAAQAEKDATPHADARHGHVKKVARTKKSAKAAKNTTKKG